MKRVILKALNEITEPLVGKGFVEKYLPFLVTLYERTYNTLQDSGYEVVDIPAGGKLKVLKKDTHLGMYLLTKGEFEPTETELFVSLIHPNSVVFDIGANFGYYTVIAGKEITSGEVYSFEPSKTSYEILKDNAKLNKLSNVTLENVALGDVSGEVTFFEDPVHTGRSSVTDKGDYKVKVVTLDEYCTDKGIEKIDLMKVDVEGYEVKVLNGARHVISRSPKFKLLVEYNTKSLKEQGIDEEQFFEGLASLGLRPKGIINEQKKEVVDYSKVGLDNVLRRSIYTNILFVKD